MFVSSIQRKYERYSFYAIVLSLDDNVHDAPYTLYYGNDDASLDIHPIQVISLTSYSETVKIFL
jgi:hypothetical protein